MKIYEHVYRVGTPDKTTTRVYANHAIHGRKLKGGEAASPTNPKKGCAGKRNKKHAGHPRKRPTKTKYDFCMGPDTHKRSGAYWRITLISTPYIGHKKTKNPNPAANPSVASLSSLKEIYKRSTRCHTMMNLSIRERSQTSSLKRLRVIRPRQNHQRIGILMALAA